MANKIQDNILPELQALSELVRNFVILQLIAQGLGREDIRKIVKGLNNADYTAIYRAYKRSYNGRK